MNSCEHGDHEAPEGKRFCSEACQRCEQESQGEDGCDDICWTLMRKRVAELEAKVAELEEQLQWEQRAFDEGGFDG